MGIYEELQARGLIAQVTDEEEIRELVNNGKAVFNEIEDAVGARMIYEKTDIDIVGIFVDYIVEKIKG